MATLDLGQVVGPQGPDGKSLRIMGTLEDTSSFPESPEEGDAYIVGDALWAYWDGEWTETSYTYRPDDVTVSLETASGPLGFEASADGQHIDATLTGAAGNRVFGVGRSGLVPAPYAGEPRVLTNKGWYLVSDLDEAVKA